MTMAGPNQRSGGARGRSDGELRRAGQRRGSHPRLPHLRRQRSKDCSVASAGGSGVQAIDADQISGEGKREISPGANESSC